MTEMMKALVAYAPHDYRYENFPRPVQPVSYTHLTLPTNSLV